MVTEISHHSTDPFQEDISKKFPDWPPGARTTNGTALWR